MRSVKVTFSPAQGRRNRAWNLLPRRIWGGLVLWSCLLLGSYAHAATRTAVGPAGVVTTLPGGDFESPVMSAAPNYQYRPTGSAWTFNGGSGLTQNGTAFTIGNPATPNGSQVLFLQGTGWVEQSVNLVAGYYTFGLLAAQRGNHQASAQTFELRVDGVTLASITPAGTAYDPQSIGPVYLGSGSHTVQLRGMNPNGGDNTAFIDLVTYTRVVGMPVAGGDMESPTMAPGSYQYRPTGGPWTFFGGAGLSTANSAFTNASPAIPQGTQIMFLQNTGYATLPVTIAQPGNYRVRFKATLRANNDPATENQVVEVMLNNVLIDHADVGAGIYNEHYTLPLYLAAGTYTLRLKGLNPNGGDNTAFVDDVRLELMSDVQDAWTWGGTLPGLGDDVVIPTGASVALRGTVNAKNATINGELVASQNQSFGWISKNILIMGANARLEAGREGANFPSQGTFTLNAVKNVDPNIMFMGNKFIAAMSGATLNLHGLIRKDWTQLNGTVQAGVSSITLAEPVDWVVGDSIVIAPTDFNPHEAEALKITSVSLDKKTLGLSSALNHRHYGAIETYANGTRSWDLDQRAEVGLLTRNILIQGDASSTGDGFGAHVMVMQGSFGYVEGVEFFLCGQKAILARYPFHWHRALDVSGQYLKHSTVHRSYNRIVTVHHSQNATIEGVVGYDHIGHGFFLETADETGCVFRNNLGILTRKPMPTEKVEPHDLVLDGSFVKLPSTYWIANPGNTYVGNASAGSEGSGFWMVSTAYPIEGTTAQPPYKTPMGAFDDNRAHTNSFSNFAIDGGLDTTTGGPGNDSIYFVGGHYRPESGGMQVVPVINRFTGFKCASRNIWMRANTMVFDECAVSDSRLLVLFAYNQQIKNSLLVGISQNTYTPLNTVVGYNVYDGPAKFENCHFTNFSGNAYCVRPVGAAQKSTVHSVEGLTFDPAIPATNRVNFSLQTYYDHMMSSGIIDLDGSLTGIPGGHLATQILPPSGNPVYRLFEDGFSHHPSDAYLPNFKGYVGLGSHYGLMRLDYNFTQQHVPPIYSIRSDGYAFYTNSPSRDRFQTAVIVGDTFEYRYQFHQIPNRIESTLRFTAIGDKSISVLPNMPSGTTVRNSANANIAMAASLAALRSQNTPGWYLEGNTLYLNHTSTSVGTSTLWQFGTEYPGYSYLRLCPGDCNTPAGKLDFATLADFENPTDSRVFAGGTVGSGSPIFDATAAPGGVDNKVRLSFNTDGDGVNEYRQIQLKFDRQVWGEFKTMQLNFAGAPITVYVHDKTHGYLNLGSYNPGSAVNVSLTKAQDPNYYQFFDEVDWILLRVFENSVGSLNSVIAVNADFYEIRLYDTELTGKTQDESGEMVADISPEDGLAVFPNPTSGLVTLQGVIATDMELQVQVMDLQGRILLQEKVEANQGNWSHGLNLRAAGLSEGIYLLQVSQPDGQRYQRQVVVQ